MSLLNTYFINFMVVSELKLSQRKIVIALAKNGYVGHWYETPRSVFLKVYPQDSDNEIDLRVSISYAGEIFDHTLSVHGISFLHYSKDHYKLFNGAIEAIVSVSNLQRDLLAWNQYLAEMAQ